MHPFPFFFILIWFDSILLSNMFQYFWFGQKESEIVCEWEFECNKSVAMGKQAYKMLQLLNEINWIYIDKVKILKYAIQLSFDKWDPHLTNQKIQVELYLTFKKKVHDVRKNNNDDSDDDDVDAYLLTHWLFSTSKPLCKWEHFHRE